MGAFIRDTELDEQEQKAGFEYRTYLANFIKFGIPENSISNPTFESFQSSGKILHIQITLKLPLISQRALYAMHLTRSITITKVKTRYYNY